MFVFARLELVAKTLENGATPRSTPTLSQRAYAERHHGVDPLLDVPDEADDLFGS
jgi:hypothetical protein